MAEKETMTSPLNTVMFNVPQVNLKSINPTDIATDPQLQEEYKRALAARDKYTEELEKRYQQPNWFKVAAGFAKPQLGGFLASMGSASQALGDWQEQARAIAPTIAQMRAETAMGQIALQQGLKAADIAGKARGQGRIQSPTEAAQVAGLTGGPATEAKTGQEIQTAQIGDFIRALSENRNYLDLVKEFGKEFVDRTLPGMLTIPGIKPPPGYSGAGATGLGGAPAPGGEPVVAPVTAPAAAPATPAAASETKTASGRIQIPGVDVDSLTEAQYLSALKDYNTLQQEKYQKLTSDVSKQATGGQKVFETAQQIHDVASSPTLTPIFAQFEKGNPAGIIGKMLESQSVSSTLANMREYVQKARLGASEKKDALTRLNQLETLMGSLQTEMQNAVINPTNERTMAEFASLPGLRNTQDAFLRSIRYIANEGLTKYENQFALQNASKTPQFDPNYWTQSTPFQNVLHNSTVRRNAIVQNPGTQDRPAFMRGSIDEVAFKGGQKKEQGRKRPTAKELREQANKED
jgi:FMN-dependent NADH-azoreductase